MEDDLHFLAMSNNSIFMWHSSIDLAASKYDVLSLSLSHASNIPVSQSPASLEKSSNNAEPRLTRRLPCNLYRSQFLISLTQALVGDSEKEENTEVSKDAGVRVWGRTDNLTYQHIMNSPSTMMDQNLT